MVSVGEEGYNDSLCAHQEGNKAGFESPPHSKANKGTEIRILMLDQYKLLGVWLDQLILYQAKRFEVRRGWGQRPGCDLGYASDELYLQLAWLPHSMKITPV